MIDLDIDGSLSMINGKELELAREKAAAALEEVQCKSGEGAEWLGWRDLMADPDDKLLQDITDLAEHVCRDADTLIVCGIGGSYLGARAVIEALHGFFPSEDQVEVLYAGNNISGKYLEQLIDKLERPKSDGSKKSVYLNVISKSGKTLETALAFRILRKWMHNRYGEGAKSRIFCTTSKSGGALNKVVEKYGYKKFVIPADVGGRFSVLTPVGLLPIAISGIDVKELYYGAVGEYERLENDNKRIIEYAAARYILYKHKKEIDVIGTFEPELHYLCKWMQQLLGESEGKDGKGIFPAVTTYSTDLHSLGQMIQQGERNIMETFINVSNSTDRIRVDEQEDNSDELNYLAGKTYHEVNNKAFMGTRQAHVEGGVPTITVTLENLDTKNIGEFIYFYELFTATFVYCLGVNPFNQPGVEAYKEAMYRLLGKNGV